MSVQDLSVSHRYALSREGPHYAEALRTSNPVLKRDISYVIMI